MVLNFGFAGFNISSAGGIGIEDYATLINKPSINNIVLSGNKTTEELGIKVPAVNYGIRGDYCSRYGIIDVADGLIEPVVETADLDISAGIVMCMPGKENKVTIGSADTYSCQCVNNFTLFYLDGGNYFEAEEICWQDEEPNGEANTTAWWSPALGYWQFKSNEEGNVFKREIATPLCDVFMQDEVITRVDFIGYRQLNAAIYATKDSLDHCVEEVEENAENIGSYSNIKQDKTDDALTTDDKTIVGAINELKIQIDNIGGANG